MRELKYFFLSVMLIIYFSCDNNSLDREKERIEKEARELKSKIDSSQVRIDSARKDLDSLSKRYKIDSLQIDSTLKKINPFRK